MSRGASASLASIKDRISDMKSKIDDAEEREYTAKQGLIAVLATQLKNETEAKSLANRIESLQAEVDRVKKRSRDIASQLDENDVRSKQSEDNRKTLQDKEDEGFERSQELESTARTVKYDKEEIENKYREASLREKALQADIDRVDGNLQRATEKAVAMQRQRDDMEISTKGREDTVNGFHEREDDIQEKIAFLNDQIKQVTTLGEERRAKEKTTERYKDKLLEEIKREAEKKHDIEKQFEEIEEGC